MSRPTETATPMDALLATLDLEKLEENLFRGRSPQVGWQRVFGGQVIGQALVAAQRTVDEGRYVHSLHAYFMRPGDPSVPIIYEVDRIRDGSSFATRRVVAIQHGKAIFSMSASFQYRRGRLRTSDRHPQRGDAGNPAGRAGAEGQVPGARPRSDPPLLGAATADRDPAGLAHPLFRPQRLVSRPRTSGSRPSAMCPTSATCRRPCLPTSRT